MLKTLMTCVTLSLLLCACVTRPVLQTPPASCASLIPDSWRQPIAATPIPARAAPTPVAEPVTPLTQLQARMTDALNEVKAWAGAFVAEGAQREKASGRTIDTIQIIERCEALVNQARP